MEPKQRFCKQCAGPVDPHTKKCQQCGKQYFNKNQGITILACTLLSIGIVFVSVFCFSLYQQNKTLAEQLKTANSSPTVSQETQTNKTSSQVSNPTKKEGYYDSIKELNMAIKRNPKDFENKKVSVDGFVYRDDDANKIYLIPNHMSATNFDVRNYSAALQHINTGGAICVIFKDDTKNKALTGDYISLTGTVTDTENDNLYTLINATYKIIEQTETFN